MNFCEASTTLEVEEAKGKIPEACMNCMWVLFGVAGHSPIKIKCGPVTGTAIDGKSRRRMREFHKEGTHLEVSFSQEIRADDCPKNNTLSPYDVRNAQARMGIRQVGSSVLVMISELLT